MSLTIGDRVIEEWEVPAGGRFFKRIVLEPGTLAGDGPFTRLVASYKGADGRPESVRLTQLMVASPQSVFHVQHAGWNESEYSDQMQRRWRWTTGRAETFVNAAGRDLTLTIAGESPLRYFDTAPRVTVRAGNQVLATAQPSSDFELSVKVPAAALAASDGMLTIETDQSFVPHERSGSPDRRTLGLRIFDSKYVEQEIRSFQKNLELLISCSRSGFFRQAQQRAADRHIDAGLDDASTSSASAPENSAFTGAGGT